MKAEQTLAVRDERSSSLPISSPSGKPPALTQVAADVWCLRDKIVNLFFVGNQSKWTLIDAGLYGSASTIKQTAEKLFGTGARPRFIYLTHGHFDHIGAVKQLAEEWNVTVYAHERELPYLTGRESYLPPDPSVGGGLMAASSFLYPRAPINLGTRVTAINGESLPEFDEWRVLHTPGHTPGHTSLFRERDRVLIAGDAFVTTKQESFIAVMTQKAEMHGPPAYFTPDWVAARSSVEKLAALKPEHIATGHGQSLHGREMQTLLETLARDFNRIAVPSQGRYVPESLKRGQAKSALPISAKVLIGAGIVGVAALLLRSQKKNRRTSGKSKKFRRPADMRVM